MARVGRFRPRVLSNVTGSFLSGQQLLGCDTVDSACNGVFVDNGFVVAENDPCTEASYIYITIKGVGKASSCTVDRPGKCRGIQGRVYRQRAGFNVDSDTAIRTHRPCDRPVLVFNRTRLVC